MTDHPITDLAIRRTLRPLTRLGDWTLDLPRLVLDAGPEATTRVLEFFVGQLANPRTRAAYARAVGQFFRWCVVQGLTLETIAPLHVATYIRAHQGSTATVKQHLAAIRMLCDWLVVTQVLPTNPAGSVRGPRQVITTGTTPVLTAAETRVLLDGIDTSTVRGLRDRALIGVMVYSFARVSAVIGMRRADAFTQGGQSWFRLLEKGGRRHLVPAHHQAVADLVAYLDAAVLPDPLAPLFQSVDQAQQPTGRALLRRDVLAMVKRHAQAVGLPDTTCCHTFRATGITTYLSAGGTLEHAQALAGHASPTTTKLYDRTRVTLAALEVERIVI